MGGSSGNGELCKKQVSNCGVTGKGSATGDIDRSEAKFGAFKGFWSPSLCAYRAGMVGYAENAKGYRIYKNGNVEVHKNVIFNELEVVRGHEQIGKEDDTEVPQEKEIEHQNEAEEPRYPKRERRSTQFYKPGDENTEIAAVAHTEPMSYEEEKTAPDKDLWQKAMESELESLEKKNTWDVCELPPGRKTISTKWVFQLKKNEKGETVRHKARLAARGFTQKQGVDCDEVFDPVAKNVTFRTMMAVAASRNLEIIH